MEQDISFINNIGVVLRGNPFFVEIYKIRLATSLTLLVMTIINIFCWRQQKRGR